EVPLKGMSLTSKILKNIKQKHIDDINDVEHKFYDNNLCVCRAVIDSIQIANSNRQIKLYDDLTVMQMVNQFSEIGVKPNEEGITLAELRIWRNKFCSNLNIYVIDPVHNLRHYKAESNN